MNSKLFQQSWNIISWPSVVLWSSIGGSSCRWNAYVPYFNEIYWSDTLVQWWYRDNMLLWVQSTIKSSLGRWWDQITIILVQVTWRFYYDFFVGFHFLISILDGRQIGIKTKEYFKANNNCKLSAIMYLVLFMSRNKEVWCSYICVSFNRNWFGKQIKLSWSTLR